MQHPGVDKLEDCVGRYDGVCNRVGEYATPTWAVLLHRQEIGIILFT